MQESKQEIILVVSLVKMAQTLSSVSVLINTNRKGL